MDENTLSVWGWILIAAVMTAVLIALAAPYSGLIMNKITTSFDNVNFYYDDPTVKLSKPANLSLSENVFSFDSVANADSYFITVKSDTLDISYASEGNYIDLSPVLAGVEEIVTITVIARDSTRTYESSAAVALIEDLG